MERARRGVKLYSLLALVLWWGCQAPGEVEPPAPTPSTSVPAASTTAPPEPPPGDQCALPDVGRGELACYVTRERAGVRLEKPVSSTGLLREMMFDDQELVAASRNFLGASRTCRPYLGKTVLPFVVTPGQLAELAARGFVLHDGGRELGGSPLIAHPSMLSFIGEGDGRGRLELPHRNCPVGDETNPWCGRTGVFRPALKDLRARVAAHMGTVRDIDGRAGHLGFDGLRAWCEAQK